MKKVKWNWPSISLVLLCLTAQVNLAYSAHRPALDDFKFFKKIYQEIIPTTEQQEQAKLIKRVYYYSFQEELRPKVLELGLKSIPDDGPLGIFGPWVKSLKKIENVKNLVGFRKVCSPLLKQYQTTPLGRRLSRSQAYRCRLKLLELFKQPQNQKTMSQAFKKIWSEQISEMLDDHFQEHLIRFLEASKKNPSFHKQLSFLIAASYIRSEAEASPEILKEIEITSYLTNYVQMSGYNPDETHDIFYKELRKLLFSTAKKYDDKEIKLKDVQKEVTESVKFFSNNMASIEKKKALRLFNTYAKKYRNRALYDTAEVFSKLAISLASEDEFDASFFQYMLIYVVQEKYEKVLELVKEHKLLSRFNRLSNQIKFWIAYTHEKLNLPKRAINFYERILQNKSFDYYIIQSNKRIQALGKPKDHLKAKTFGPEDLAFMKLDIKFTDLHKKFRNSLKRLCIWSSIKDSLFTSLEGKNILSLGSDEIFRKNSKAHKNFNQDLKEYATILSAFMLRENKRYLSSFYIIYDALSNSILDTNRITLEALFPRPYLEQITKLEKTIDPVILLSLIRQESAFNPKAKSRVGARGLMQLMPATARQIKRNLATSQLHNPKTNLDIGIKHFKMLMEKYEGNLVYVLSAYNAGEASLERWRERIFRSDSFLHIVEAIPYAETQKYVKLIYRNVYFYKLLNQSEKDTHSANKAYDVDFGLNG